MSTGNGADKLIPFLVLTFVKGVENADCLLMASRIDEYIPQLRERLEKLFLARSKHVKNGGCYKVTIPVEKLMEHSTDGSQSALLVFKIVLEEEVAYRPSSSGKNLIDEISGQDGLAATRIGCYVEKTRVLTVCLRIPLDEEFVVGEPFACAWHSLSVSVFGLRIDTGKFIEQLEKFVNFLMRHI